MPIYPNLFPKTLLLCLTLFGCSFNVNARRSSFLVSLSAKSSMQIATDGFGIHRGDTELLGKRGSPSLFRNTPDAAVATTLAVMPIPACIYHCLVPYTYLRRVDYLRVQIGFVTNWDEQLHVNGSTMVFNSMEREIIWTVLERSQDRRIVTVIILRSLYRIPFFNTYIYIRS